MDLSALTILSIEPPNPSKLDVRILGYYTSDSTMTQVQIIARQGKSTDLEISKGGNKWEMEMLLPPNFFSILCNVLGYDPAQCFVDNVNYSEFQVSYALEQGGCTVTAAFDLKS